jgi:hypothetical protein
MAASTFKSRKLPSRQATERAARTPSVLESRRNLENVKFDLDQKVVALVSYPISELGGAVGRDGLLAPAGAITKVAQMTAPPFPEPFAPRTSLPCGAGDLGEARAAASVAASKGARHMRRDIGRAFEPPARFRQSGVFKDQCGMSRTRPRGRGFPCGWEGEHCL